MSGAPDRRVLFVTNMWPDERRPYYGSFIASQARSLAQTHTAVDVVYVRGFLGPQAYVTAVPAIPRFAHRKPYDVIHIHYGHTAVASVGVAARSTIISFCGEDLLGAPRDAGITRKSAAEVAVFRQIARTATATITKSEEMALVLPRSVRARNHVVPNGVDLDAFAPRSRESARIDLGWNADEPVLLFLGNPDDPRKNVELARSATGFVRHEIPSARLHVAWGVAPEHVPTLMNAADCLLFPSRSEGSPNAIKEAMACALPIVASPVGDIADRLKGVGNCYVVDPTPTSFARAASKAVTSGRAPEARAAVERLGLRPIAEKLAELYDAAAPKTNQARGRT